MTPEQELDYQAVQAAAHAVAILVTDYDYTEATFGAQLDAMLTGPQASTPVGQWWADKAAAGELDKMSKRIWQVASKQVASQKRYGTTPLPDLDALAPSTAEEKITLVPFAKCSAESGNDYIVKNMIGKSDLGCIFAQPGVGKSVIAPLISYRLANGELVFGQKVKQTGVLYVAAEDTLGMERRFVALRERYGGETGPALVRGITDLTNEDQLKRLAKAIKKTKPGVVIIDTLAVAFGGLDENSSETMGYVVKASRALCDLGPAVILVHHTTKNDGGTPRGHSVFNAALDMSLHLKPADKSGIVRGQLMKNRNGACDLDIAFNIESVSVGMDSDGDEITAACGEECKQGSYKAPVELTPKERGALQELDRAFEECSDVVGQQRRVAVTVWRKMSIEGVLVSGSEKQGTRRNTFNRAMQELVHKQLVHIEGDYAVKPIAPFLSDLDGCEHV